VLRVGHANQFVELQQIDGICLEALEGFIKLFSGGLPGAPIDFGHEENLLAVAVSQGLAHADFAFAAIVIPRIVHEVNTVVDGSMNNADALLLIGPAEVGNRPNQRWRPSHPCYPIGGMGLGLFPGPPSFGALSRKTAPLPEPLGP